MSKQPFDLFLLNMLFVLLFSVGSNAGVEGVSSKNDLTKIKCISEGIVEVTGGRTVGGARIYDFSSFNVAADQEVDFIKEKPNPGMDNRIISIDGEPSQIYGAIRYSGAISDEDNLVLYNSKGITFNNKASIDTGAFDSTLELYIISGEQTEIDIISSLNNNNTLNLSRLSGSVSFNNNRLVKNRIKIFTGLLELSNGAQIIANGNAIINTPGSVSIFTSESVRLDGNSLISTSAIKAGNIRIDSPSVELKGKSQISSTTPGGNTTGGQLLLTVERLDLRDNSLVSVSSAATDQSDDLLAGGGEIIIRGRDQMGSRTKLVTIDGSSKIFARSVAAGSKGGNIKIVTEQFLGDKGNIDASSQNGSDGIVEISTLKNSEVPASEILPSDFSINAQLNDSPCQSRANNKSTSSFVVNDRSGVAASPDNTLSAGVSKIKIVGGKFVRDFSDSKNIDVSATTTDGALDCVRG